MAFKGPLPITLPRELVRDIPPLATVIGASEHTVRGWVNRGNRPSRFWLERLASALGITLEVAVAAFWKQELGSPCPCGCGAEAVLPAKETSCGVAYQRTCPTCGRQRIFDSDVSTREHKKGCAHCSRRRVRSERLTFTCCGYDDHGRRRWACGDPPSTKAMTEAFAKRSLSAGATIDLTERTFQCRRCQGKERMVDRVLLRGFVERARAELETVEDPTPGQDRIIELDGRDVVRASEVEARELQRLAVSSTPSGRRFLDAQPKAQRLAVEARKRRAVAVAGAGSPLRAARRALVWRWQREKLPDVVIGVCDGCGRWTFRRGSEKALSGHWHQACLVDFQRSGEGREYQRSKEKLPAPRRGRGRPTDPDNLRRSLAWAIRHHLGGESFREIAEDVGVSPPAVEKAARRIIANLPSPALMRADFRNMVELLLSASN